MLCCCRISAIGTAGLALLEDGDDLLSANQDFHMGCSLHPAKV
jgi:hypothetical protein